MNTANLRWERVVINPWPKAGRLATAILLRKYPRSVRIKHAFYSRSQQRTARRQGKSYSIRQALARLKRSRGFFLIRLRRKLRKPHWPAPWGGRDALAGHATRVALYAKPIYGHSLYGRRRGRRG